MMKTKKSSKGLALVLAAVLALTPMAGFPITALATGEAAAPKAEAPATDAADAPAVDAGDTLQPDAPAADADANTDTAPGTTPSTPAVDAETPQAEAPATDAGTNLGAAGSVTKPPATNAVTPDLTPTPTPNPDAANDGVVDEKDFPDPIFWAYVQKEFDKNGNQTLEADEIEAATTISTFGKEFETLRGVEHLTALTVLTCNNAKLRTLDLTKNTALVSLDLYWNYQLTKLELPATDTLAALTCSMTSLEALDLRENPGLTRLDCQASKLITLNVSQNPKLTYLKCNGNNLPSLELSQNTKLTYLECTSNPLTALDVSANTALTTLLCSSNQLTTLDVSKNTGLTKLDCSGTPWDLAPSNKLTALDLTNNPKLTWLDCYGNNLTALDLTNNTALTNLRCHKNQLTTLELAGLKLSVGAGLSPQAPQIPVVKRGESAYELDLEALAKGRTITAITLDGTILAPKDYQKMRDTAPTSLQYTCETGVSGDYGKEMTIDTTSFAYSYPIGAKAEGNGSISWEGKSAVNEEFLVPENSKATFTIAPNPGSELASVLVDGTDVTSELKANTYTFNDVTAPHTIAATFTTPEPPKPPIINYYSVTPTVENGTIDPAHPTTVREGNSLKYTFSPKEGYAFESVSVNGAPVEATDESTATKKTYSYTINNIDSKTTIHVIFKAIEPPVDPTDPVDPPKPPVDPTDPVDPPKPPVDPADPINPPTPPAVPDNGGNNNGNNGGGTTIVERTNTVTVPAAPQAAALAAPETPATSAAPATTATKTEAAPAKAAADNAAPQGQLENPALGAQGFDTQHSHIPLALLLLAVWLVGGFAVIRQRKHTHDAIEGTSY